MSAGSPDNSRIAAKLLVSAPDVNDRLALNEHLESMGYKITLSPDLDSCKELLRRGDHDLALVIHDPDHMDGIGLLEDISGDLQQTNIILLAVKCRIEDAVKAMQLGAQDFLCRPWTPEILGYSVKRTLNTLNYTRTKKEQSVSRPAHHKAWASPIPADKHEILTQSPVMEQLLEQAGNVAPSRATVLIQGESGTGKELLARFIHRRSDRANGSFVAVNCAALPETLLESELFGHEKGAFSGAISKKLGRFELANGGTLLLDEITEMAVSLQAKLLRVLQEGEIDRLGGTAPTPVDVRVVVTTNKDVLAAVRAGQFREDLYFRINVIPLKIPPLRERIKDIPYLAEHFRKKFTQEYGKSGLKFASGTLEGLETRPWSGNIREIRNIVERGVLLARNEKITLQDLLGEDDLHTGIGRSINNNSIFGKELFNLNEIEREMVKRALGKTDGNRTHAAKLLGISVRTLRNKLAEYRQIGLVY